MQNLRNNKARICRLNYENFRPFVCAYAADLCQKNFFYLHFKFCIDSVSINCNPKISRVICGSIIMQYNMMSSMF